MIGEDLFLSASGQGLLLLRAFGEGITLGLLYEGFRAVRRVFGLSRPAVALLDGLLCFFAALFVFRFFLAASFGKFRLFLAVGMAGGFFLYSVTLGRLLSRAERRLSFRVTKWEKQCAACAGTLFRRCAAAGENALRRARGNIPEKSGKIRSFFSKKHLPKV